MKIEDQVVSLELSKRLKELGIKQDSYFCWFRLLESDFLYTLSERWQIDDEERFDEISAFTVAELMDMLPACIDMKEYEPFNYFFLQIHKRTSENIKYIARYVCDTMPAVEAGNPNFQLQSKFRSHSEKLTDCLAIMLIHLIENNLITMEK